VRTIIPQRIGVSILVLLVLSCTSQNRPAQLVGGGGPTYPAEARALGIEGVVTVLYDIEVDGHVSNLVILSSEPKEIFDQAALTAVSSWQFNPKIVEGQAVASRRRQSTVTFRLEGSDAYDDY
jgi:TonB family protein